LLVGFVIFGLLEKSQVQRALASGRGIAAPLPPILLRFVAADGSDCKGPRKEGLSE
jgi:hypothetical protein